MPEIPPDALAYKRTATFDENTVPGGLLKEHDTKEGVWARIVVESGKLAYTIIEPDRRQWVLSPAASGVAAPTAAHFVKPIGEVRFHVEFFRREADPT